MTNYDGNFEEFEEFEEFEKFIEGLDEENQPDYGYAYFPDATKIIDYDELDLVSNVKYKILGYIDGMPIIRLPKGLILELLENEIDHIVIVPPEESDTDDMDDTGDTDVSDDTDKELNKYIKFVESLWLDNAIDLSLVYKDEEAFKKLMLIKYPKNN